MRNRKPRRRKRLRVLTMWTLGTAALGLPAASRAQAIYLGIDAHQPTSDHLGEPWTDYVSGKVYGHSASTSGRPIRVNWHRRSYLDDPATSRFGVAFRRAKIVVHSERWPSHDMYHTATEFQVTFDRKLFQSNRWVGTAGVGFGWAFFGEDREGGYGNPDAAPWFPGACWAFTPELRLIYDTKLPVSAYLSLRHTDYLAANDTPEPFTDGTVFSLGLLLH